MAALLAESFPLDSGKIDFSILIATLSILCFKVSQVDFPNKCVLQSLYIAFIIANSADPDEMQQITLSGVPSIQRVYFPQSSNAPGSETTRPRALLLCL